MSSFRECIRIRQKECGVQAADAVPDPDDEAGPQIFQAFLACVLEDLKYSAEPVREVLQLTRGVLCFSGGVRYHIDHTVLTPSSRGNVARESKTPLYFSPQLHKLFLYVFRKGPEGASEAELQQVLEKTELSSAEFRNLLQVLLSTLRKRFQDAGLPHAAQLFKNRRSTEFRGRVVLDFAILYSEPEISEELVFLYSTAYEVFRRMTLFPQDVFYDFEKMRFFRWDEEVSEDVLKSVFHGEVSQRKTQSLLDLVEGDHVLLMQLLCLRKDEFFSRESDPRIYHTKLIERICHLNVQCLKRVFGPDRVRAQSIRNKGYRLVLE